MKIPKIKKKVTDFLVGEQGSISKEKLIKTGTIIVIMAAGAVAAQAGTSYTHSVELQQNTDTNEMVGTHSSSSHTSHSSHSSHGHSW